MTAPRSALDAERAVLGAVLSDPACWDDCAAILRAEDFTDAGHAAIWAVIEGYAEGPRDWDVVMIGDALRQQGLERKSGGLGALIELAQSTPSSTNADRYARIVRGKSKLRALDALGERLLGAEDFESAASEAVAEIEALAVDRSAARLRSIESLKGEYEASANEAGWSTGWADLDALAALHRGEQIVVGARPSVGKSSLLLQLALRLARLETPAALYSLEEPGQAIYGRALRQLDEDPSVPLWVDSTGTLTIEQLRASVRQAVRRHGVGLVLVDYLQLVEGRGDIREQQVSSISRMGKRIALDEGVCVVMAAQLARKSEERIRPRLSDLRESGAIEQDADQVWLLHANSQAPFPALELEVAKNRNGPKGRIVLRHFPERFRFESLEEGAQARYWQTVREVRGPNASPGVMR